MSTRTIAAVALAALLAACSSMPDGQPHAWNDGIWNSVLGYVGPGNAMVSP